MKHCTVTTTISIQYSINLKIVTNLKTKKYILEIDHPRGLIFEKYQAFLKSKHYRNSVFGI